MAKRGDVRIREKEGFKCPWFCEHRATREPKAVACTLGTLKTDCGKAFSLLRFFVAAKDQEMKCRHAQWLIAIKNLANIQPALT